MTCSRATTSVPESGNVAFDFAAVACWVDFVDENDRPAKYFMKRSLVLSQCVKLRLQSIAFNWIVVEGICRNVGTARSTVKSDMGTGTVAKTGSRNLQ